MWDPHVKAFLLLQAYFSRIDLPIADYIGDQTSVLDQSIRIVQALIDILTELNLFHSCNMMITLLQCIKCARWPDDGPLAILPGVSLERERLLAAWESLSLPSLSQIHGASRAKMSSLLMELEVPRKLHGDCMKVIDTLPDLKINVLEVNALGLIIGIGRLNVCTQPDYRIFAPKYPKPQFEGYFTMVVDTAKEEILAMKRINWQPNGNVQGGCNKPSLRISVKLAPESTARNIDILIFSDAYIGMRWRIERIEVPAVPDIGNQIDKSNCQI